MASRHFAGLLRQAWRVLTLRLPRTPAASLPASRFVATAALFLICGFAWDWWLTAPPREFNVWSFGERSATVGLVLLIAWLIERLGGREGVALRLASVALLVALPWVLLWRWAFERSVIVDHPAAPLLASLFATALAWRLALWSGIPRGWLHRCGAGALIAVAVLFPLQAISLTSWWWTEDEEFADDAEAPSFNPEDVLYAQPTLLEMALSELPLERPGHVDLYAVGFAGDGDENVFRNEVRHFEKLVAQRLSPGSRALALINHPQTVARTPLATRSNLRRALDVIAQRMNRQEDILLLFLTSHGSEDHELYVGLDPLPLDPITPDVLRDALDEGGIRWRVIVVSACYSGGFIPALRNDHTLVITAARADRTSFGCGHDSKLTWFGRAFLVDALNRETDFVRAFDLAEHAIRKREREEHERASHPQIAVGRAIEAQLARWRADTSTGPSVPFRIKREDSL